MAHAWQPYNECTSGHVASCLGIIEDADFYTRVIIAIHLLGTLYGTLVLP